MYFKRCFALIFVQALVFGLGYGVTSAEKKDEKKDEQKDEKPKLVMVEGTSSIPLRVITRPGAIIYKEDNENENERVEEPSTFKPYYVYTRPKIDLSSTEQKGWYQIGEDNRGEPKRMDSGKTYYGVETFNVRGIQTSW